MYKLTTKNMLTGIKLGTPTLWEVGVAQEIKDVTCERELCTNTVFHAFPGLKEAVLFHHWMQFRWPALA